MMEIQTMSSGHGSRLAGAASVPVYGREAGLSADYENEIPHQGFWAYSP